MRRIKSSTLCIVTRQPGACGDCRHANQGTADFRENHVFCQWDRRPRRTELRCDVSRMLSPSQTGADAEYFMFETFDGTNCTWHRVQDSRILAEDADAARRREMQADQPFLPAGEG